MLLRNLHVTLQGCMRQVATVLESHVLDLDFQLFCLWPKDKGTHDGIY